MDWPLASSRNGAIYMTVFARIEERVEKVGEDPAVKNRDEEELLLARLLRKLRRTRIELSRFVAGTVGKRRRRWKVSSFAAGEFGGIF